MNRSLVSAFLLALSSFGAVSANANHWMAVTRDGDVYRISRDFSSISLLQSTSLQFDSLAQMRNGRLFATTKRQPPGRFPSGNLELIELDPKSGAVLSTQRVADVPNLPPGWDQSAILSLSFSPDDELYGIWINDAYDRRQELISIDRGTGDWTSLGVLPVLGSPRSVMRDMAFSNDGTLYSSLPELGVIEITSSPLGFSDLLPKDAGAYSAMAFDSNSDLYGAYANTTYKIDINTGARTTLSTLAALGTGVNRDWINGLQFIVPEPPANLLSCSAILALAALRRRK